MISSGLDVLTRRAPCALIAAYQRHISPHKGFHCAYRVQHGGQSCSGYIKRMIHERGLMAAIPISRCARWPARRPVMRPMIGRESERVKTPALTAVIVIPV